MQEMLCFMRKLQPQGVFNKAVSSNLYFKLRNVILDILMR